MLGSSVNHANHTDRESGLFNLNAAIKGRRP
jgi:hypothetical protein